MTYLNPDQFRITHKAAKQAVDGLIDASEIKDLLLKPELIEQDLPMGSNRERWTRGDLVAIVRTNLAGQSTVLAFERDLPPAEILPMTERVNRADFSPFSDPFAA